MKNALLIPFLALLTSCSFPGLRTGDTSFVDALIRHELSSTSSYMGANRSQSYYVSVEGRDLSTIEIRRLSGAGVALLPGSAWRLGKGMKMTIGAPAQRPDGDFDVAHSYYCGERCAADVTSIMKRSGPNWSVVSSTLQGISMRAPNNSFKPEPLRTSA